MPKAWSLRIYKYLFLNPSYTKFLSVPITETSGKVSPEAMTSNLGLTLESEQ